ncbi:hypothetical protein HYZ78_00305 [Candidatus Microgenomates bacterium]|nr:hypothetical protein [Candidatus Microgenomates bacterium]
MAKKKDEFYDKFAEAFHDVVVPVLEDMQGDIKTMQGDINTMKGDIKEIRGDIEDINRSLDRVVNRQVEHDVTLNGHERRIQKLEKATGN